MTAQPAVLITGASTGIGAVYADRFARRGHDLVLVARDVARMEALAERLRRETGVAVDIIKADLTDAADVAQVEARLRDDARIGVLVNNAGAAAAGGFLEQNPEGLAKLISLNVVSLTRLANAVAPRFVREGKGAIVNIGSVVGLAPEIGMSVYGATKAFVLFLTQGLHLELGPKGVYVQAVLPAATRTEIWERSERDVNSLSAVMEVDELVDAALVGFDRRETVTIPSLPDGGQWTAFDGARQAMVPNFLQVHAAERYRKAA
ncbi:SDR family NAD(P)-dependent oxidoreductase [Bosea caraganae]|uniref:SDR family NAD(P)-dependent oxidoreductase n=1 Tax=Bosea caraganae TaxID=2763117 RepID=A0A370LC40_9HYPH|nr:SDR family oxidoreductase [Bosea caraganae]RDJ27384.1 SDR family NAD(P)-dependent oxidoreductase [Bosea caraganae]RDJ29400.1 SDR family NAD(P)-dependent oxidoreductase [Bosea caraganae]